MKRSPLLNNYRVIRQRTESLCEPLCVEDYVIQSMPDVSPPKWHLGHTSWFFERVILEQYDTRPQTLPRALFLHLQFLLSELWRSSSTGYPRHVVPSDSKGSLRLPAVQ